jgi:hypothetical protein
MQPVTYYNTVLLSGMYGEWGLLVAREKLTEIQYKVETTHFHFSSCMGVFLADVTD